MSPCHLFLDPMSQRADGFQVVEPQRTTVATHEAIHPRVGGGRGRPTVDETRTTASGRLRRFDSRRGSGGGGRLDSRCRSDTSRRGEVSASAQARPRAAGTTSTADRPRATGCPRANRPVAARPTSATPTQAPTRQRSRGQRPIGGHTFAQRYGRLVRCTDIPVHSDRQDHAVLRDRPTAVGRGDAMRVRSRYCAKDRPEGHGAESAHYVRNGPHDER